MTDVGTIEDVDLSGAEAQEPSDGRGESVAVPEGSESDNSGVGGEGAASAGDDEPAPAGKPHRKIAIIGTAPSWKEAPFADSTWEIWGLSRLYKQMPRWTCWFEIHEVSEMAKTWEAGNEELEAKARAEYVQWLGSQEKPVLVHPDMVPVLGGNVQAYPRDAILRTFKRGYFTNTIAWMLALAIAEGVQEIGLWGVDMALSDEYKTQRASCEYFIGMAEGCGIKVSIPDTSDLLKTRTPYALLRSDAYTTKITAKRKELQEMKVAVDNDVRKGQLIAAHLAGGLEILEFVESRWG